MKLVIFDLDGVITSTSELHYLAWKQLADQLSLKFDKIFNENLKGVSRIASLEKILEYNGVQESYNLEEKVELTNIKNKNYIKMLKKLNSSDIMPGITDFIKELKQRGIPIAIASVSDNAGIILRNIGLDAEFDYIVNTKEIARSKPFPDIFLRAAQEFNVLPKDCIGIEDAEAGIEAINSAGIFSVGVGESEFMVNANLILKSTSELNYESLKSFYEKWVQR